jgi:hypothetical protein
MMSSLNGNAPDLTDVHEKVLANRPGFFRGMIFYYGHASYGLYWAQCTNDGGESSWMRRWKPLVVFKEPHFINPFHIHSVIGRSIRFPGEPGCPPMPEKLWRKWSANDTVILYEDEEYKCFPMTADDITTRDPEWLNNYFIYIPEKDETLISEAMSAIDIGRISDLRTAHSVPGVTHCVQCGTLLKRYWGNIPPSCPKCEP